MIDRVVLFSAKHRALVILLTFAACVVGWICMRSVPIDAVPDLSQTQVIVVSKWDRNPGTIEDQVTYPIVSALTGAPKVRTVRGISDFGASFVYVVFDEGTDLYWARARTQEYLAPILSSLPAGVETLLGPDATSLGWVMQYAVVDTTGKSDLARLRSIQDWYIRSHLRSVKGVSEIASVGGFQKQYQVNVDPRKLRAYNLDLRQVIEAVRGSNSETGARLLSFGDAEYMVQGLGYLTSKKDLEQTAVATSGSGTPVMLNQLGQVTVGPEMRRGIAELDGQGEAVTGIVVMRNGESVTDVLERVRQRIAEITPGLPSGVQIVPIYDRSLLVHSAVSNLTCAIFGILVMVMVVICVFLWHLPSALISAVTLPAALLLSFIFFRAFGLSANIMSLCGIAIATGALVDASIVVVEQTHKRLEIWRSTGSKLHPEAVVVAAVQEVARPSFFALLVIAVSFLPVILLPGDEGKLFRPLALTKSFAMIAGAVLAITFDPALRLTILRWTGGRTIFRRLNSPAFSNTTISVEAEDRNPVSRALLHIYKPALIWAMEHRALVLTCAAVGLLATVPLALSLQSELMPPLEEGTLLYMPSMPPGISVSAAKQFLESTDAVIKSFPEVDHVLGKAGRSDSATDPAPLSMLETVITLRPEREWPIVHTWYSNWAPRILQPVLVRITPNHISVDNLVRELDVALNAPGVTNAWTMPIQGRITMLSTGVRTSLGVRVSGRDTRTIQALQDQVAQALATVPGARSVYAERNLDGYFVDVRWNRSALARYGITLLQAQEAFSTAVGGENVTTTIEGRERYPVNVRYMRDFRSDLANLNRVLIPTNTAGRQIPLGELGEVQKTTGPAMLRDEDGLLTGYVYIDAPDASVSSYLRQAQPVLDRMTLPSGYSLRWTGQFDAIRQTHERLRVLVPLTLLLVALLLWLSTRSMLKTAMVLLAVPFSLIGAFGALALFHYSMSTAVWIGLIVLLGVDAETGIFMLLYLDLALRERRSMGLQLDSQQLRSAVLVGAAHRIRPKVMTVATMLFGLLPILVSTGPGALIMKHIAVPVVGGLVSSFLMELLVYPIVFEAWHERQQFRPGSPAFGAEVPESAVPC